MKKVLTFIIGMMLVTALVGCGQRASAEKLAVSDVEQKEENQTGQNTDNESKDSHTETADESKALVAYFSLAGEQYEVGTVDEGNTAIIAKMIAEETGADLFQIEPATPYPDSYDEKLTVATEEQRSNARPEIKSTVENMADYDTVYIGYPIWWGDMPMIVYNFLESYDFSGKTVIPFSTHAGSGLAGTESKIADICKGANLLEGLAVAGKTAQNDKDAAKNDVTEWLEGIGQ